MIKARSAVLRKPNSGLYVITAVIALMIAYNGLNRGTEIGLDGALPNPGQLDP
jgi:hypothetical protein